MVIQYTNSFFYIRLNHILVGFEKKTKLPKQPKNSPQNTSYKLFWIQLLRKLASSAALKYGGVWGWGGGERGLYACWGGFLFCFVLNVSQLKVWPMDINSFKSIENKIHFPLA